MSNIVEAMPRIGVVAKTKPLWQYDSGQIIHVVGITLPATYKAEFSNTTRGNAVPTVQTTNEITVPAQFLRSGNPVYIWLVVVDENSRTTEYAIMAPVTPRAQPTDETPTPEEQSEIDQAIAALNTGVETVQGIANAIPETINTALAAAKESGEFDGEDGVSPAVTVTEITGGHQVTITDAGHPAGQSFDVLDGQDGTSDYDNLDNKPQIGGVTLSGNKSLSDLGIAPASAIPDVSGKADKVQSATSGDFAALDSNGNLTDSGKKPADYITQETDPTVPNWAKAQNKPAYTASEIGLGNVANERQYSANNPPPADASKQDKITASGILKGDGQGGVTAAVEGTDYGTYSKPVSGIPASDLASGVIPAVPSASDDTPQALGIASAGSSSNYSRADHVHAKPSAADVGAVPAGQGIPSGGTDGQMLVKKSGTDYDTEWANQPSVPVQDVQVNGTSILSNGVANVPIMSMNTFGIAKSGNGLYMDNGKLNANSATEANIKAGTAASQMITPARQHISTFYGLAKAAGDSTQSASSNAVGTYTDTAIDMILAMVGIDALIGKHETAATASEAKSIGDVFIYSGKLYKVTDGIASGAAIVPGTNCTQTNLIELIRGM